MRDNLHDTLLKAATDAGMPIEAGWQVVCSFLLPPNALPDQVDVARRLFFLGAQHLFAVMNAVMDEGREPTSADLARVDLINTELEAFLAVERSQFQAREKA